MTRTPAQIEPRDSAKACVIWLHGLGADGTDFLPVVDELALTDRYQVRFILPHAPERSVTINAGMMMPAWFDILSFDRQIKQDEVGIMASVQQIQDIIQVQVESGLSSKDIYLAGFSQGGAIALYTALTYHQSLGGVVALSAYLPLDDQFPAAIHTENKEIRAYMAHGQYDPVVPMAYAMQSQRGLVSWGIDVAWHSYPVEHHVCRDEIDDLRQWFVSTLGGESS